MFCSSADNWMATFDGRVCFALFDNLGNLRGMTSVDLTLTTKMNHSFDDCHGYENRGIAYVGLKRCQVEWQPNSWPTAKGWGSALTVLASDVFLPKLSIHAWNSLVCMLVWMNMMLMRANILIIEYHRSTTTFKWNFALNQGLRAKYLALHRIWRFE